MDSRSTDASLLAAFVAGDDEALGRLAQRHERRLLGLALGLLGGRREVACDVVQDVWLRVIRSAATFEGRASVTTWLTRITVNRCRDERAAEARRGRLERAVRLAGFRRGAVDAAPPEPESVALHRAVAELPAERREIVLLCYHAELTHEQVAEVLGIPVGTVKSRLHAALRTLRAQCPPEDEG